MMKIKQAYILQIFLIALLLQFLSGCLARKHGNLGETEQFSSLYQPSPTPFQPLPIGTQPISDQEPPVATDSIGSGSGLWINPLLPASLVQQIDFQPDVTLSDMENASLRLTYGTERTVSYWTYVLAAPFSSLIDHVSVEELHETWQGNPSGAFSGKHILLDENTKAAFISLWGKPAGDSIRTLPADELLDTAWSAQSFALLPFESLSPRWKVLHIDSSSPLSNKFDDALYPLRVPISLSGPEQMVNVLLSAMHAKSISSFIPATNRDPSKLTVLAMTGVTALVRATAHTMELKGITYPAEDIGDILRGADLTHISNEVPFASDCPFPNPIQSGVRFCSDPRYIELLESVGTDIVELTGDHFADWGAPAMYFTLELYDERNWQYYGGGYNINEGKKPITIDHNGNRLAFIGCNGKGGQFATASDQSPGSVYCDFPYMQSQIKSLSEEGYQTIATFQHYEYYTYFAQPAQQRDFQALADAGAVIVSGSQAHQPQAIELRGKSFIHYGLGNLFFDQYLIGEPTRQGFIDLHIFYDGRYINTELITIYFIDFAKPRLMTAGERSSLLSAIFSASVW